jgi:H+/Cl- antiporter ClcA
MSLSKAIAGSALIFSGALLLSARIIAAALMSQRERYPSYEGAIEDIGRGILYIALLLLISGAVVLWKGRHSSRHRHGTNQLRGNS